MPHGVGDVLIVLPSAGWHMAFEYTFHWRPVFRKLPELLDASVVTLQVSILSMVIGIGFG